MLTRIRVNLAGKEITHFQDLSISQRFDHHHRMDLHLGIDDANEIFDMDGINSSVDLKKLTTEWVGKEINLKIEQGSTDAVGLLTPDDYNNFRGYVSKIQLQMRDAVDSSVLVSVVSPTILLDTGEHTRSFVKKKLSDIVKEVIKPAKKFASIKVTNDPEIPYTTQYRESNYHFLQRLASRHGEWFYYNGKTLLFGKEAAGNGPKTVKLEYGSNLKEMYIETKLIPLNSEAFYYDYFTDKDYVTPYKSARVKANNYGAYAKKASEDFFEQFTNTDLSYQNHRSQATQVDEYDKAANMKANQLSILRGKSTNVMLQPGVTIAVNDKVQENGLLRRTDTYGEYVITSVSHYVDSGGEFSNNFEAIPSDPESPPVNYPITQPIAETQLGEVVSTNDPDRMGRIKVNMHWRGSKDPEEIWIPVSQPMSGTGHGVFFVPEVGQKVFVDFELGNPDLPFARGSFSTGRAQPGNIFINQNNYYKGFITITGNTFIFNDTPANEEIHIHLPDFKCEIKLSIKAGITINSDTKITFNAPDIIFNATNIVINAKENIIIDAGDAFQVDARRAKIETTLALQLSALASLLIESKVYLKVESWGHTEIEGKTRLMLGSQNLTEMEAPEIKIKAGPPPRFSRDTMAYKWIPLPDTITGLNLETFASAGLALITLDPLVDTLMQAIAPSMDGATRLGPTLTLESDFETNIKSKTFLNVDTDEMVVKASDKVEIEAKNKVEVIGGSKIKIDGGPSTEIKGGKIELN